MTGLALIWPDGTLSRAASWEGLLEDARSHPWNAVYPNVEEFRRALAKRAWVWSLSVVDPTAGAEEFIRQLAKADLVRIIDFERLWSS